MANPEHLTIIKQGGEAGNAWIISLLRSLAGGVEHVAQPDRRVMLRHIALRPLG
jgi:hypothetical protein